MSDQKKHYDISDLQRETSALLRDVRLPVMKSSHRNVSNSKFVEGDRVHSMRLNSGQSSRDNSRPTTPGPLSRSKKKSKVFVDKSKVFVDVEGENEEYKQRQEDHHDEQKLDKSSISHSDEIQAGQFAVGPFFVENEGKEKLSPRSASLMKKNEIKRRRDISNAKKVKEGRLQEKKLKNLDFDSERKRVISKRDDFFPNKNTGLAELESERQRQEMLDAAENSLQSRIETHQARKLKRIKREKDRLAATAIQRRYRGVLARNIATEYRNAPDPRELLLPSIHSRLEEPHTTPSTNSNLKSKSIAQGSDQLPQLRGLATIAYSNQEESLKDTGELTTRTSATLESMNDADNRSKNSDIPLELELEHSAKSMLFLPDGKANTVLRDTVRNALKVSRWDSVSTLLAHQSLPKPVKVALHRGNDRASGFDYLTPTSNYSKTQNSNTAAFAIIGKHGKRRMQKKSDKTNDFDYSGHKPPPAIRNVTQTGMDIGFPGFDGDFGGDNETLPSIATKDALPGTNLGVEGGLFDKLKEQASNGQICFNCWSAGRGKTCVIHRDRSQDKVRIEGKDSSLVCANWDLSALNRRYRSEALQEVFAKMNSSLRWDVKRRRFFTVIEAKHPIYRAQQVEIELCGRKYIMKRRMWNWLRSFIEQIRLGTAYECEQDQSKPKMLRLRKTLQQCSAIIRYRVTVRHHQPVPPVTGSDEIISDPNDPLGRKIILGPTPEPQQLYRARAYPVPKSTEIPILTPYLAPEELWLPESSNPHMFENNRSSWIEQIAGVLGCTVVMRAHGRLAQVKDIHERRRFRYRTRHPPINTDAFAVYFCKGGRVQGGQHFSVSGLSKSVKMFQTVCTAVPQQYGNYVVIITRPVAPQRVLEKPVASHPEMWGDPECQYTTAFSYTKEPPQPCFTAVAGMSCILDHRRAPTVGISCVFEARGLPNYYGINRPKITNDHHYTGFRTTEHDTEGFQTDPDTNPDTFVPSESVVVPNSGATRPSETSCATRDYPFRGTTTRENTLLDFYHLLPGFTKSCNDPCFFSAVSQQDPGQFGIRNNLDAEMGPLNPRIFRSFRYAQTGEIEEYKTDEGLPYWYNKRTGDTYWEPPLDFLAPPKDAAHIPGVSSPLEQSEMRRHMLMNHEQQLEDLKQRHDVMEERKALGLDPSGNDPRDSNKMMKHQKERPKMRQLSLPKSGLPNAQVMKATETPRTDRTNVSGRKLENLGPQVWKSDADGGGGQAHRVGSSTYKEHTRLKDVKRHSFAGGLPPTGRPRPSTALSSSIAASVYTAPDTARSEDMGPPHFSGNAEDNFNSNEGLQMAPAGSGNPELVNAISQALRLALPAIMEQRGEEARAPATQDLLGLGLGIGLGIGMRNAQAGPGFTPRTHGGGGMSNTVGASTVGGITVRTDDTQPIDRDNKVNVTVAKRDLHKSPSGPLSDSDDEVDPTPDSENYVTHGPAGEGHVWEKKRSKDGPLQKSVPELPADFMASIYATRTGRQHVDYLPAVPNLNEPSYVGTVKPRGMLEDWLDTGYDPWSEGKEPTKSDHISSMNSNADDAKTEAVPFADTTGIAKQESDRDAANREETLFEELKSHVRHGKYEELEDVLTSPDFTMDIDFKDKAGNTLLLVAAQNGNKRIVKLCLRRGSNINETNAGGNTALHYCYSYKFESLAKYMIDKGCDDSLVNAFGLTCYEGLDPESLDAL